MGRYVAKRVGLALLTLFLLSIIVFLAGQVLPGSPRGDLGVSYQYRAPVSSFLLPALAKSLKLAAVAFVIVVPLSVLGGVVAALYRGRAVDRIISTTGFALTTVPEFVSGVVLIVVFAIQMHVFPVTANAPPGSGPLTQVRYLVL